MDLYATLAAKIDDIEAEMKALQVWQDADLPPSAYEDMGPFGIQTMSFEQWLQFVLVPRARQIVAERGDVPAASSVAAMAVRSFDGLEGYEGLIERLSGLDQLFTRHE